mmetsp:Transcript_134544/g.339823  ORF Transcript_134544/g.339823 Transcript_134544/m.339823 type:complete len:547 (+) Transcript_134544:3-1643(+)
MAVLPTRPSHMQLPHVDTSAATTANDGLPSRLLAVRASTGQIAAAARQHPTVLGPVHVTPQSSGASIGGPLLLLPFLQVASRRPRKGHVATATVLHVAPRRRPASTLDEDEIAEAARLRDPYLADADRLRDQAIERQAAAQRRMLKRRLTQGVAWRGSGFTNDAGGDALDSGDGDEQCANEAGEFGEAGGWQEAAAMNVASGASSSVRNLTADDEGENSSIAATPINDNGGSSGAATSSSVSALRPALAADPTRLAAAEALAADPTARSRSGARQLASAAAVLSQAGKHSEAADLLYSARDFGVEQDVLTRRIDVQAAEALFGEVSVQLGVELRAAGRPFEAWRALLEACAEERQPQRFKEAMSILADIAIACAKPGISPQRQVELLQAVVDAELVERTLPADRWDELRLTLAMALPVAGFAGEARDVLAIVARSGSSAKRRRQAEWIKDVQSVDVSQEQTASSLELQSLWDEAQLRLQADLGKTFGEAGIGSSATAAAAAASSQDGAKAGGGETTLTMGLLGLLVLPMLALLGLMLSSGGSGGGQ